MKKTMIIAHSLLMLIFFVACSVENTSKESSITSSSSHAEMSSSKPDTDSSSKNETSSYSSGYKKVDCFNCSGSGSVKYYDGKDDDYHYGTCPMCDGKGYEMQKPQNNSSTSNKYYCSSCRKYVTKLIYQKDLVDNYQNWCSSCWDDLY